MPIRQRATAVAQTYPIEGILLDLALLSLGFWHSALAGWTAVNYRLAFGLIGPLQAVVVGFALYTVMQQPAVPERQSRLWETIQILMAFMGILAVGGFMWLYVPALALENAGGWVLFMLNFFVVLFGSLLVYAALESNRPAYTLRFRGATAVPIYFYLVMSETLTITAVADYGIGKPAAFIGILLAYLPIRLILIWRPPHSLFELGSAAFAFFAFLNRFFSA